MLVATDHVGPHRARAGPAVEGNDHDLVGEDVLGGVDQVEEGVLVDCAPPANGLPHKRNPEGASAEASALSGFLFLLVRFPVPSGTTEAAFRPLRSLASGTSPSGSG